MENTCWVNVDVTDCTTVLDVSSAMSVLTTKIVGTMANAWMCKRPQPLANSATATWDGSVLHVPNVSIHIHSRFSANPTFQNLSSWQHEDLNRYLRKAWWGF